MRGGFSGAPVSAATSRATPKTLRPWPRFGVSLSVKIVSSSCRCWRRSAPTGARVVEDQQAAVVLGELELARRAEHAAALDAADLADLDAKRLGVVALARRRQLGADARQRHLDAGAHVRRAADDLQRLAAAGVHLADAQLVGVRMLGDLEHLGDDDAVERRRRRPQVLDLEPGHGQPLGELGGRDRRIAELAQPGFGELHVARGGGQAANWRRKRRSPSKKRRRSSMP